jgi:predicted metal-binding transcription factor (methanogenesis marker protein 9)
MTVIKISIGYMDYLLVFNCKIYKSCHRRQKSSPNKKMDAEDTTMKEKSIIYNYVLSYSKENNIC